jgi:type IV secretory pathway protease TraF
MGIIEQDLIFVEGDHPDPTSSDDSHNFGKIPRSSVLGVVVNDAP